MNKLRVHAWLGGWLVVVACSSGDSDDAGQTGGGGSTSVGDGSDDGAESTGSTGSPGGTDSSGETSLPTTGIDDDGSSSGSQPTSSDDGGPTSSCDVFAQDCPDGEKCMPYADMPGGIWTGHTCVPIASRPKQPGEPCTVEGEFSSGVDDCDEGLICWDPDEAGQGFCRALCEGSEASPTCADACSGCTAFLPGIIHTCTQPCDPLAQDCPAGEACLIEITLGVFGCTDDNTELPTMGQPCTLPAGCGLGLLCAPAALVEDCEADRCCRTGFCELDDPVCPQGTQCTPLTGESACEEQSNLGLCGPGR